VKPLYQTESNPLKNKLALAILLALGLAAQPTMAMDTDGDNIDDFIDRDSDNDGILNADELSPPEDALPPAGVLGQFDPFPADYRGFIQIINDGAGAGFPEGQIFAFDVPTSTYIPFPTVAGFSVNGLAYAESLNALIAVVRVGGVGTDAVGNPLNLGDLVKIDVDGELFKIGETQVGTSSISADVVGNLMHSRSASSRIDVLDITGAIGTTADVTVLSYNTPVRVASEIIPAGDRMYQIDRDTNTLRSWSVNGIANGSTVATTTAIVAGLPPASYGAGYPATSFSGSPELYFSNNTTGVFYRIDGYDTATPVAVAVAQGVPTGQNDGAARGTAFPPFARDADDDGTPDFLDLDSDNDGISDLIEAGADASLIDANNDGLVDSTVDADGIPVAANGGTPPVNTDSDFRADFVDLDSDNDGIPDSVEAQDTVGYQTPAIGADSDADGVVDTFDSNNGVGGSFGVPVNSDSDATPDYLDTDSDGDGTTDTAESGLTLAGTDADVDGIDDAVNADYADPDGDVNAPANDLTNADTDASDVDYRSVDSAPPVATADNATTPADTTVTIALADNVSDVDGDAVVTTIDLDPSTPGVQSTLSTADGDWSVDSAGVVTFDPAAGFEGNASIPYVVSDSAGNVSTPANVTVNVSGATPVATPEIAGTTVNTPVTTALANNVSDPNNDIDITTIDLDPATPGIQTSVTTPEGDWTLDTAGDVTFDPTPGFEGSATVPYVVSDDDGNVSAPSDVTVVVAGATPVATNDSATTPAGTSVTISLADNVSDLNNDVVITSIDLDPSTPGVQATRSTANGDWSVNAAGAVVFDPAPGFEGTESIPYVVSDDDGNVSAPATLSVTVNGAAPVATADAATTAADTPVTVALADNINDPNSDEDVTTIDLDPATPGVQNTLSADNALCCIR